MKSYSVIKDEPTTSTPPFAPSPLSTSPSSTSCSTDANATDANTVKDHLPTLGQLKINIPQINISLPTKFTHGLANMWEKTTDTLKTSYPSSEDTSMGRAVNHHVPREHCVVDEEPSPEPEISLIHDLIAGGVAGSASVIVGHPFDTIKVRLQTSSTATLAGVCDNVGSLFRGMGPPLSTAVILNAIVFSSFGYSSRLWDNYFGVEEGKDASADWKRNFVCGSFAGFNNCLLICPTEHVKCRLQVLDANPKSSYKGPSQVVQKIYSTQGIPGLYRGWWATAWREIPAFGLYFAIYDTVKNMINEKLKSLDPEHSHSWGACAIAGGISGSLTWAAVYPFDVMKTKIQTSPLDSMQKHDRKMWYVTQKIIREEGWRCMFRGMGIALIRAFPVNGIIFPVYEFTLMYLVDNGNTR